MTASPSPARRPAAQAAWAGTTGPDGDADDSGTTTDSGGA